MYYVYILKSKVDNKLYIGSTPDLRKRIGKHNKGEVSATKARRHINLALTHTLQSK